MKKQRINVKNNLHKALFLVVFAFSFILLSGTICYADEKEDVKAEESVRADVDSIIDEFGSLIPEDSGVSGDIDKISETVGIKHIFKEVIGIIKGQGGELSKFLLSVLGVSLMSALVSLGDGELSSFASRSVCAVFSVMLLDRLIFLVLGAVDSLKEINTFFGSVIPVAAAVNSLGVTPSTAATQAVGMGITLGAYSFIGSELLASVVSMIFVFAAASAIDPIFERISIGVKSFFVSVMGILTVLIGATFSLQSAISASADSALVRSAKYAISSTIPIVGGTISGALGITLGGVSYARGVVGGGAIAVVIALMISPLVTMLAYRFCLKAGTLFCSVCSLDGSRGVLQAFLGAIDALVATYSLTSVIYIVELVAFLKGGVDFA